MATLPTNIKNTVAETKAQTALLQQLIALQTETNSLLTQMLSTRAESV